MVSAMENIEAGAAPAKSHSSKTAGQENAPLSHRQFQPLRSEMLPSPRLQKAGKILAQDLKPAKSLFDPRSLNAIERHRVNRHNKVQCAYGGVPRPKSEGPRSKTPGGPKYLTCACVVPSSMPLQKSAMQKITQQSSVETSGFPRSSKPWCIVEATSWLQTSYGDAQERLPPKSWLVLDVASGSSEAIRNSSGKSAWRALFGGGLVAAGEPEAFCEVPEYRVTIAAAEANMQRASRGCSILALRHAAKVLDLAGAGPEEAARAKRLEGCVLRAAEMREQHHAESTNRPPSSQSHVTAKRGGLADFRRFCLARYGNIVRAWHKLDTEGTAALGQDVFHRATEAMGYQGPSTKVWRELDLDGTGIVTILELDPHSARALAKFKFWALENWNGDMDAAFRGLDRQGARRIPRDAFCAVCTEGGLDPGDGVTMPELFDFLDRDGHGAITTDAFTFIKRWRAPPFLLAEPDQNALNRIKQILVSQNGGSPLRAWRSIQQKSPKVGWRAWPSVCEKINILDEATILGSWRALDLGCTGRGSLKEFDEASYEAVTAFVQWAVETYGGLRATFTALDTARNGRLSLAELRAAADEGCSVNLDLLFEGLDGDDNGRLLPAEMIGFLERCS